MNRLSSLLSILLTATAVLLAAISVFADEGEKETKGKTKPLVMSPEREAAVLTFVRLHHAELESLLNHLRDASPKEYEKACRELYRVTERLSLSRDRDSVQYELELRSWKAQSRLQLLSAKMQMASSAVEGASPEGRGRPETPPQRPDGMDRETGGSLDPASRGTTKYNASPIPGGDCPSLRPCQK
jgi:hypothetical protein